MKDWWGGHRSRLLQLWGVGIACSLLVTVASAMGYLEFLQVPTLDLMLSLQGQWFASEVVIVAIDDAAFESLGRRQPLSREYLARLLRALQRSGAAVVGLDVALTSSTMPADDAALAEAILDFSHDGVSRVVMAETGGIESGPLADPTFLRAVVRGSAMIPVDDDGVIRRVAFLRTSTTASPEPALSLAIAARLAGMDQTALELAIRTPDGKVSLPTWRAGAGWDMARGPQITIGRGELRRVNFAGPAQSFLTIPSGAVVPLSEPGATIAWNNPLRDRIVLVGGTFRDSQELFQTPRGLLAGVEVHANLVHMLVTRRFIESSGWAVSLGLQVAVCLLTGVALTALRPLAGTFLCVMGALLVGLPTSYLLFHKLGYWVDLLLPMLAICLLGIAAEAIARRRLREAFGRYVSREVMSQVMSDPHSLRGERREVSILFSDLRGFTPLCEAMPVEAVAVHLNEYFAAMTEAIFTRRGMINDFVGDPIMAVFGAPLTDPDHALHAVQSAMAMEQALSTLNQRWEAAGPVAVLSEIRTGQGEVWVQHAGTSDWMPLRPLLALHVGDQIRVAGDGQAVLIFTGGGTQTVLSANSPYTVQPPTAESGRENVGALVGRVTQFLLGQGKSPTYRPLAVRNPLQPVILSPRETKLLPGPVTFEWSGPDRLRYSIRVRGPQGLLREQAQLSRQPLRYPEAAPALRDRGPYTWELQTNGQPVQRAQFELLPPSEAARIQEMLALLQPDALSGYPPHTVLLLRTGLFFREGLYQEARRELLAGIAADPNEPTLHLLLGHVYDQMGLKDLAAEAFEEARLLSTSRS